MEKNTAPVPNQTADAHAHPQNLKGAFGHGLKHSQSGFGMFDPSNRKEEREFAAELEESILEQMREEAATTQQPKVFDLGDVIPMVNDAASKIKEDEFTRCFLSTTPHPWNWNIYLFVAWAAGVVIRYCVLFPLRALCLLLGTIATAIVFPLTFYIKDPAAQKSAQLQLLQFYCKVFVASWSGVIRYHGPRPQKRSNQVFVANHTTIMDIVVLQQSFCFSIVGQKHPGTIGFIQDTLLRALNCLWFDRKDANDRTAMSRKIKEHVRDDAKLPLLLFPEGTCVNNEYCVMFKKGAFEIGATVYPIAIKYNKLFSDPFWNSRKQTFFRHLFNLMTGWAVVCDVWYMEPQTIKEGESAEDFSNRIKSLIAKKAGLVNVPWDGYLKYFKPSDRFVEQKRKIFASTLVSKFVSSELSEDDKKYFADNDLRKRSQQFKPQMVQ